MMLPNAAASSKQHYRAVQSPIIKRDIEDRGQKTEVKGWQDFGRWTNVVASLREGRRRVNDVDPVPRREKYLANPLEHRG